MSLDEPFLTSAQNPKIKAAIKLRDRRDRDRSGSFLIEGYRELLRAVEAGHPISQLFICPALFLGSNEGGLIEAISALGATVLTCSESLFRKLSYRDRPDGLIAIASQQHKGLRDLEATLERAAAPFLLVAEAIEKPGNLGTILRSCDAVGVDGLILCDKCTDIHNPNVVRASVGTLFTVPLFEAQGSETISWLQKRGVSIIAATPSATIEYTDADLTGPIAIAVGTEQLGLSPQWMEGAVIQVKIPMRGRADSLNVAMAATLLMYEAARQRRGAADG